MLIKRISVIYALILILLFPYFSLADDITLDNWMHHPDVKEIRKIYNNIKNGVKSGKYKIKEFHGKKNCGEMGCTTYQFEISTNDEFILACGFTSFINIYLIEEVRESYYDSNGILRFRLSIQKGHLGNEIREEITRLYYDKNSVQIWKIDVLNGEVTNYLSGNPSSSNNLKTNKECKKYRWGQ
jgi:hypothetical protein